MNFQSLSPRAVFLGSETTQIPQSWLWRRARTQSPCERGLCLTLDLDLQQLVAFNLSKGKSRDHALNQQNTKEEKY